MIGMNHQTFRRILAGDRDVTVYELLRLAEALGLSDREILALTTQRIEREAREQSGIQRRTETELG
jgi:plasmid maintenance system antidote protein VapI